MAASPNGYSVDPRQRRPLRAALVEFVGAGVRTGAVFTVLRHVAEQWHVRVEPIDQGRDEWSGVVRRITGGRGWSNHASLSAIDVNATQHPYGVRGTFTARQRDELRSIGNRIDNVVRFGEFYDNPDGMHVEIDKPIGEVRAQAARIKAWNKSGKVLRLTGKLNGPTKRAINRVSGRPDRPTLDLAARQGLYDAVELKRTAKCKLNAAFYDALRKWCNQHLEQPWHLDKGASKRDVIQAWQVVLTRAQQGNR